MDITKIIKLQIDDLENIIQINKRHALAKKDSKILKLQINDLENLLQIKKRQLDQILKKEYHLKILKKLKKIKRKSNN